MRSIILFSFSFPDQRLAFLTQIDPTEYEVIPCADIDEAAKLSRTNRFEILFYVAGGPDIFAEVKAIEQLADIPCIVFGAEDDPDLRLHYMKAGTDFYLPVNVDDEEFLTSLNRIERSLRKVEQLAYRDALTGAYNRRYFETIGPVEIERGRANRRPVSLVLLDIDRFKQINDTYGHPFGDVVLKGLAEFLQENKRVGDFVFRLGGEEFVILFPDTGIVSASKRINQILRDINITPVADRDGSPFFISFSAGASEWKPGYSISEWLKQADVRLYEAKKRGRNCVVDGLNESKAAASLKDRSVLVSCQSDDGRGKYRQLFKEAGKIYIADTFTDTLRQLESQTFDVMVIEDYFAKNDYEIVQKVRKGYTIPIVMVFPNKCPDMIQVINAGVDDCLIKPYVEEDILYKVEQMLSK